MDRDLSSIFGLATRLPPANMQAEQALLGAIMANNKAFSAVAGFLMPEHFADPVHGLIYEAIKRKIGAGRIADALTLHAEFVDSTALQDAGGVGYLAQLLSCMVGLINTGDYGRAIYDAWHRRELIDIGEALVNISFRPEGKSSRQIQDELEGRLLKLAEGNYSSDRRHVMLDDAIQSALDAADAAARREGPAGLSTGFASVDEALNGLEDDTLNVLAGRPGMGKAQPLDAPVLLADGTWRAMGDLRFGDELASVDGAPNWVAAIHERGQRQVYRVTLSDGRSTEACAEHLWQVKYRDWQEPRVVTTLQLSEMLARKRYIGRLSIDRVSGHFGRADLPLDPYVLGALLGDGTLLGATPKLTSADPALVEMVQCRLGEATEVKRVVGSYAYSLVSRGLPTRVTEPGSRGRPRTTYPVQRALEVLGLAGLGSEDKFIPPLYLRASRQDRLDLLRGLLDTDGWAEKHASIRLSSASRALAEGVQALVRSLGGACRITHKSPICNVGGRAYECLPAFVCNIRHPQGETLFGLKRKSDRAVRGRNATVCLTVKTVVPTRVTDTRCITVTHPSSLYVTDGYIVTHNSALGWQWAIAAARQGIGVLAVSLEMSAVQLGRRALSVTANVPLWKLKRGRHQLDAEALMRAQKELAGLPLSIEDGAGFTPAVITMKARAAHKRHGLGLIMVDHLHIVRPEDADMRLGPTHATGVVSLAMKRMAKEFRCPVLLLAQLSRAVEGRDDRRPTLPDLRQSGSIEQDADTASFIYRPEYHLPKSAPERKDGETSEKHQSRVKDWYDAKDRLAGKAELIIDKVRDGAACSIPLRFDGQTTSFAEAEKPHE